MKSFIVIEASGRMLPVHADNRSDVEATFKGRVVEYDGTLHDGATVDDFVEGNYYILESNPPAFEPRKTLVASFDGKLTPGGPALPITLEGGAPGNPFSLRSGVPLTFQGDTRFRGDGRAVIRVLLRSAAGLSEVKLFVGAENNCCYPLPVLIQVE